MVKKLKLTGTPDKIFRNTAFIKDMFTSAMEVSKFEGAKIRTVSGIRGQVKKAVRSPPGAFRATFEDKIIPSDIVFLRAWVPVKIPRFYNPVSNMLGSWEAMRTVRDIRVDRGIPIPVKADSEYKEIKRAPGGRTFQPLQVPASLKAELPFAMQSGKQPKKFLSKTDLQRNRAVIKEKPERDTARLVEQLTALRHDREKKTRKSEQARAVVQRKKHAMEEKKRLEGVQRRKKEIAKILYGQRPSKLQKSGEDDS